MFLCQVAISDIVSWMNVELGNPLASVGEGEVTKTFLPDRNPRLLSSSGERRKAEGANGILNGMEPRGETAWLSQSPHTDLLLGRGERKPHPAS